MLLAGACVLEPRSLDQRHSRFGKRTIRVRETLHGNCRKQILEAVSTGFDLFTLGAERQVRKEWMRHRVATDLDPFYVRQEANLGPC